MNSPDIGGEARQLLDLGFNQIAPVSMMIESRGLAALREGNGSPALRLAGWERPFLRGFTWRQQDVLRSMLLLERRPLIQWTE
jgi:hypothetical protein